MATAFDRVENAAGPRTQTSSAVVAEFYARARRAPADLDDSMHEYLSTLSPADRLAIARATAADADPRFNRLGISLLVKLGHEDEAAARLAVLAARGTDVAGFVWSWIHGGDPSLADRMLAKIKRYLREHRDEFHGEERDRVDRLLSHG